MSNYIDNVLIKLRREYSKDEFLEAILKKQKEIEFENGVLKSEVEELKYNLNKCSSVSDELKGRFFNFKLIKELKNKNKQLTSENKKLKKEYHYVLGKLLLIKNN